VKDEEQEAVKDEEQEAVKDEEENAGREGVRLFGIWRIPFISRGFRVQMEDCKFPGLAR